MNPDHWTNEWPKAIGRYLVCYRTALTPKARIERRYYLPTLALANVSKTSTEELIITANGIIMNPEEVEAVWQRFEGSAPDLEELLYPSQQNLEYLASVLLRPATPDEPGGVWETTESGIKIRCLDLAPLAARWMPLSEGGPEDNGHYPVLLNNAQRMLNYFTCLDVWSPVPKHTHITHYVPIKIGDHGWRSTTCHEPHEAGHYAVRLEDGTRRILYAAGPKHWLDDLGSASLWPEVFFPMRLPPLPHE